MIKFACTKHSTVQDGTIQYSDKVCVPERQVQQGQQVVVRHLVLPWHAVARYPDCYMYSGFQGCCCCLRAWRL